MSILTNPILSTDSYKFSHFMQYPEGTTEVFSHVMARGSNIEGCNETVMMGLQPYIKERLLKPITRQQVIEASQFCAKHGTPFNFDGWMKIVTKHKGFLPIVIRAVPEGTPVTVKNVLANVYNLDEDLAWLTSYIETDLLRAVWYPTTVASLSRHIKKTIKHYLDLTSDNADAVLSFKLHDFGFRGVSSFESAAIGGAAHLVNFLGTDTVAGIGFAMEYYDADVCAYSISASEHSTSTLEGRAGEINIYRRMVKNYAQQGMIFANVIDSYDTWNAIQMYHDDGLFDKVKAAGATVVMRPDSGDPVKTPVKVIEKLMELQGFITNSKGYKVLPDHIRVIQGDGIDHNDVADILAVLEGKKISAENIAFGMGGGLLQKVNRDTFKFAMKASHAMINGEAVDVFKQPAEQPDKASIKGRVSLYRNTVTGEYITKTEHEMVGARDEGAYSGRHTWRVHSVEDDGQRYEDAMITVFTSYGGNIHTAFTTFDEVRARAAL